MTITREQFQQAIEAALDDAQDKLAALSFPRIPAESVEALRKVGREATDFVAGTFALGDLCCPATQANLHPSDPGIHTFACSFDAEAARLGVSISRPGRVEISA